LIEHQWVIYNIKKSRAHQFLANDYLSIFENAKRILRIVYLEMSLNIPKFMDQPGITERLSSELFYVGIQ